MYTCTIQGAWSGWVLAVLKDVHPDTAIYIARFDVHLACTNCTTIDLRGVQHSLCECS